MKKSLFLSVSAAIAGLLVMTTGCEWSGGGGAGSYNSSQGAGITVNFSGVYHGNYEGGKAVQSSSGAPITRMTLTQTGDGIEVIDNNGNKYDGKVGSPGLVYTPTADSPTIPAGAELMQAQINFKGTDGSSGHDVNFVGIIHVVTISDIKTETSSSGSTNATSTSNPTTTTSQSTDGTNTTVTVTEDYGAYTLTTVTVKNNTTGQTISQTTTRTESQSETHGQTQTYSITEANSQYRLEGQWVEKDGNTSGVDAISSAGAGVVTRPIN